MTLPRLDDPIAVSKRHIEDGAQGELYCPTCGGIRRMEINFQYWTGGTAMSLTPDKRAPALMQYTCLQCHTRFSATLLGPSEQPIRHFTAGASSRRLIPSGEHGSRSTKRKHAHT